MTRFSCIRLLVSVVFVGCAVVMAGPVQAQSNDTAKPQPAEQGGNRAKTPDADQQGATAVNGALPSPQTILDLLRRLPGRVGVPGQGGSGSDGYRVTRVVAGVPIVPRPQPRSDTAAPVIVGAVTAAARPREVLVTLRAGATDADVFDVANAFGLDGQTLYVSPLLDRRLVRFVIPDQRTVATVLSQLAGDARVEIVQPNNTFTESLAPGTAASLPIPQYAPDKLGLATAHQTARGDNIIVAVIDSAIDDTHPALQGAVSDTFDALGDSPIEAETHGTAIAGILGARAGLTGVAPGANLLGIRAFARDGNGPARSHSLAIIKAIDWAATAGARVMNMSFAGPEDPLIGEAIQAAIARGIVIVAAAGNGGPDAAPAFPGAFDGVIAVTATGPTDATFSGANRGAYIALAAPGVDIIAPAPGATYDVSSGTSMAAAHISGVVALMLEDQPTLTPAQVRQRLIDTARQGATRDPSEIGAGIADAARAVKP